jgi:hypothetical protein
MLITTTPGIEGRTVTEYLGVVTAQQVAIMDGSHPPVQLKSAWMRPRVSSAAWATHQPVQMVN